MEDEKIIEIAKKYWPIDNQEKLLDFAEEFRKNVIDDYEDFNAQLEADNVGYEDHG